METEFMMPFKPLIMTCPGVQIHLYPYKKFSVLFQTQHPYKKLTCFPKLVQGRFQSLAAKVVLSNPIIYIRK